MLREDQRKVVEEVVSVVRRGEKVLLVAPMGWGKTRVLLAAAHRLGRRTLILTSRLGVVKKFAEEARAMGIEGVYASAGASELCALRLTRPWLWCPRCSVRRAAPVELSVATWEDVLAATPEDACPYYTQREIETRHSIVVAHYGRYRALRRAFDAVFVDEAHNLYMPVIRSVSVEKWREWVRQLLGLEGVEPSELRDVATLLLPSTAEEAALLSELLSIASSRVVFRDEEEYVAADPPPQVDWVVAATATPLSLMRGHIIEVPPAAKPRAAILDVDTRLEALAEPSTRILIRAWIRALTPVAVFATRRQQQALQLNDVDVDVYESWGRAAEGVDLPQYAAAIVIYPRLHPAVRRMLHALGIDPDEVECVRGIQLAGRVLRPPEEAHRKRVLFVGERFRRCVREIERLFELTEPQSL